MSGRGGHMRRVEGRDGVVYHAKSEWGYYPPHTRVLVVAPRDPHHGRVGTVTATHNDGGDMVHRVAFGAAHTGHYYLDELVSAETGGKRMNQQPQGD